MRVKYKARYDLDKPCVAKIWFGEKYVIVKSFDIKETMQSFKDLFRKGSSPGEGLAEFLTRRVRTAELEAISQECVVEIVLASERGEDLLAKEQVLLNQRNKKMCYNTNVEPLRPSWIFELVSARQSQAGFFQLKGRHRAAPAVVKLHVGEKFFIWKCFDIQVFPAKFNESMERNIQLYDPRSRDLMNPLVRYILDMDIRSGTIEVIAKASPGHPRWVSMLLTQERNLLKRYVGRPVCLNKSVKQYLPQWIRDLQQQ